MKPITILLSMFHGRIHVATFSVIRFISICAVFLTTTSIVQATTYYVSPSGHNGNLGKKESPFLTIQYGIDVLRAGDTLFVRGGTYHEAIVVYGHDGTAGNPIIIMAYPDESPVIDGLETLPVSDNSYLVRIYEDYIHFIGFEVKNSNILGTHEAGGGIYLGGFYCKVSSCIVHETWSNGISAMGDYSLVEYCNVYNTALSNKPNPGSFANGSGISSCREPTNGTTDHSVIRHNIVHDVWGEGISTFEATYSVIEDNIIYDNWSVNLYVSDATNCLVQRNLIYRTKDMQGGSQVGILLGDERFVPPSTFNTIINNIVYGCRKNLLCGTLNNVLISYNTFGNSAHMSCIHITAQEHVNSKFINNLVFQDDALPVIYDYKADVDIEMGHNLWSKKPSADAFGIGDTICDPKLAKTGSKEAGELTADYFKLMGTSPAINKGTVLGNIVRDYFDNLRDDTSDIGACEYISSNQITRITDIIVSGQSGASSITTNGGTLQLSAAILPAEATNKIATWSIQNGTGQATISTSGLVTALANGTVTATATANDDSGVAGSLTITISGQTIAVTGVSVTGTGGVTSITTNDGTLQLIAAILPATATYKTVTWSITNGTGQATISSTGLVTAIANGNVTATAIAADGSGASGNLIITILNQSIINSPPVINDQQFTIQESTFTNKIIGTVIANDTDPNQNLNYIIMSGNESGLFSIDPHTGLLTTIENIIFGPGTLTYQLIVKVADNAQEPASAFANITINLVGQSTVIYINPDNTNDNLANGSIDHPFDSWDNVTWKEGYTYLQKRGTQTTTNKILIGANQVTLGAYGEGESPVISSETNTYLVNVFEKSGIKIRDLNLQASNAVSCIYFLGSSGDSIIIERCKFEAGVNAIKVIDGNILVIRYNTITSNYEGIYSTATSNEIYYNIFKSCSTAINILGNSSKANIYNNVFFDNEKSLSVTYADLRLYNNIFYMKSPGQMTLNHGTGNIESDYNIFYPEQDGFVAIANTQFDNLEELQKSLKIDMNSFSADPLFLDIYNDNFSLGAGSPAINTGIDLNLGIDFAGNLVPSAGATDIGIAEFTGSIMQSEKLNEEYRMTIYPNPSSGKINILAEVKQYLHSDDPDMDQPEIQVMDILGKTVFYKLLENLNFSTIQEEIDLSGISNGLYFVVLHIADEFIKEKLIITK